MVHLHDAGYKYLFSHADLVRELLEVFAPPGLSELLDYGTLRPETGSFITPAMKKARGRRGLVDRTKRPTHLPLPAARISGLDRQGHAGADDAVRGGALRPSGAQQDRRSGRRPAAGPADRDLQRRRALEAQPRDLRPDPAAPGGAD
ncbi:hypothetical protein E4Q23_12615 [Candidatus Accumulibacter phosphatis]|uniref:Transposase (putative) YhgA-like domain-containing protein n=1 Tax=Candidatus Accumulibacter phosphatis TaxID=327160 RepID=A0ABX1U036_9PROT|nr:hypothetical protein [Candidatus Accumulibacter phosphatis]